MEFVYRYHYLIGQLVRRDVILKYRGSFLGIAWSFLYPLLLLSVFTLVFGNIIGSKWSTRGSGIDLALFIYCGLLVFTPFAEVFNAAPRLLQNYQAYVKKILFPTEILPVVSVLTASVHGLVNLLVLSLAAVYAGHQHPLLLLAPLVLLPAWLFLLGCAWILTAMGAYVRDLIHLMPVLTQLMMFLSPVFYPIEAAPPLLQQFSQINPLAMTILDMRKVVLNGDSPHWGHWLLMLLACLGMAILGYVFFRRCKEDYADVI